MHPDLLGWTAATLMVATFSCREPKRLRLLAVATNLAFIGYGSAAGLMPVLALHLLLLPINLWHGLRLWAAQREAASAPACPGLRRWAAWAPVLMLPLLVACGSGEPPAEEEAVDPLEMTAIYRQWEFKRYLGRFSDLATDTVPKELNTGGELRDRVRVGVYYGQPLNLDLEADQEVYSSPSGMTYWATTESPTGFTGPERPIGTATEFSQQQMFVKQSDDATLEYVVSEALVQAHDFNQLPADGNDCPIFLRMEKYPIWEQVPPDNGWAVVDYVTRPDPSGVELRCDDAIRAAVEFKLLAHYITPINQRVELANAHAEVEVYGSRSNFDWYVSDDMYEISWTQKDFEGGVNENNGMLAYKRLVKPLVVPVPLKNVPIGGVIRVSSDVTTRAYDFRQRESSAHALLRDPATAGGAQVRYTGLKPLPVTGRLPDAPSVDPTPVCQGAPDPARGAIEIEHAAYDAFELPGLGHRVTLVRQGGASGEVSVLLQTTDGTASAASDYVDATQRVRFRDGQTRRTVRVPMRLDRAPEIDETVQLRLAEPRGCAALGARTEALITIHDDDHPLPPPVTHAVGGTVSGLQSTGLALYERNQLIELTVTADGTFTLPWRYAPGAAYDVRIVRMPFNPSQACSLTGGAGVVGQADVASLQVVCDPPLAAGSLDPGFGLQGKVVDGPGGVIAMARQSSGHLVVTSGATVWRYTPDGQLDTSFGGGTGRVDNLLAGVGAEVMDLAVGADDRIVVAGRILQPAKSPPYYQMAAARLSSDGLRDTGFGSGGTATFRMAGIGEQAARVLVQPDGRVVLVGHATPLDGPFNAANNNMAVVRLTVDGALDVSFGASGAVTMDARPLDFAQAALLQPDGRLFVAGRTSLDNGEPSDSLFTRLAADGTLEPTFGSDPSFSTASDEILDVALQPDGKLVLLLALQGAHGEIGLVRRNPDGSADETFGVAGLVRSDIGPHNDTARGVALLPDGKIIVAGAVSNPLPMAPSFALLRYHPDGRPDEGFGTGGVMRIPFFGGNDGARDVLVQPDGRVVAAGTWRAGIGAGPALVRLLP